MKWVTEGDSNTKFFHRSTMVRRKRNKIHTLMINDVWVQSVETLQDHAREFFKNIFTPSGGYELNPQLKLPQSQYQAKICQEDYASLARQVTLIELKEVVWATHPLKAPGPDGLQGLFYQECWSFICESLLQFVQNAFQVGGFNPDICQAFICLIPKVSSPSTISEFRPIALCNMLYKIVTKCITMRLRDIMPKIISHCQSSFIRGRSTQDNIFVIQEVLHSLRSKKKNKVGSMVMKLDLEKAYDKVSWDFLEETLSFFNFPPKLTKIIMFSVRNASTRILWNGNPLDPFEHKCGLRQGDPLSPYLFVLCVERFSYLINDKVSQRKWTSLIPCRNGPQLSHLFFADDIILMGKATMSNAKVIREVITSFCDASGLNLNLRKSKVYFSKSGGASLKRSISDVLGFQQTPNLGRYLGIQLNHGRLSPEAQGKIFDRVMTRLDNWKKRYLSIAGRATLIQSVTSALPVYEMQASWLPEKTCNKLDQVNRKFLWSSDIDKNRIHLIGWPRVTQPKEKGGLGIRLARLNNEAMLAKFAWKILSNEDSVWLELVRHKYLRQTGLLHCHVRPSDSNVWKGIIRCTQLLKENFRWKVGNGAQVSFWYDRWLGGERISDLINGIDLKEKNLNICDVWKDGEWCLDNLDTIIPEEIQNRIINSSVVVEDIEDTVVWTGTSSGLFSCQSAYRILHEKYGHTVNATKNWKWLWSSRLNNKLKHFIWLATQDRLATNSLRLKRHMVSCGSCDACGEDYENVLHVLKYCRNAQMIWKSILEDTSFSSFMKVPDSDWFRRQLTQGELKTKTATAAQWDCIFAAAIWYIWIDRNSLVFTGKNKDTDRTLFLIKQLSNDLAGRGRLIKKREAKWSRPPEDWFKLNVDGSLDTSGQLGAVGGLLRDANGNWQWGFSKLIGPATVDEVELLAIFHGLDIAWSKRIHKLVVETDSESVFRMLTDDSHVNGSLQELVTRCMNLIHNPWDIEVKNVGRACNRSADCMAKLRQRNQSGVVFWDTPPESVMSAIRADRLGL